MLVSHVTGMVSPVQITEPGRPQKKFFFH